MENVQNCLDLHLQAHLLWLESDKQLGQRFSIHHPDFQAIDWSHVSFCEADIREGDLSNAKLLRIDFFYSCLAGASMSGAIFDKSNFAKSNLDGAILTDASMLSLYAPRATFAHTNLTHALFCEADLLKAFFYHADLRYVDFTGANISHACFTGSRMAECNLSHVIGLDSISADWIDIGNDEPVLLYAKDALEWLLDRAKR